MQPPPSVTDADLERLDDFLASDALAEVSMDVSMLEGFLTAIVIGPHVVMPSHWLPWVWDCENGERDADFESQAQAEEMIGLIIGLMNRIAHTFERDPEAFEPVFYRDAAWGVAEWSDGFLRGTELFNLDDWSALWAIDAAKVGSTGATSLVAPFLSLSDPDGEAADADDETVERWVAAIVPALVAIHAFWLERRPESMDAVASTPMRRATPKVGRNDPCPCGSGKKYKHCCGRAPALH